MLSYWRSILIKWIFFPTGLNKVDLIKFKITSETGLNGIVERDRKLYKDRIKDRLSCKRCNAYDITEFGSISNSTLFQCIHYFHPLCVTDWKNHGITIGNGDGCPNEFLFVEVIFPINMLICMILTGIWIGLWLNHLLKTV